MKYKVNYYLPINQFKINMNINMNTFMYQYNKSRAFVYTMDINRIKNRSNKNIKKYLIINNFHLLLYCDNNNCYNYDGPDQDQYCTNIVPILYQYCKIKTKVESVKTRPK